MGLFSKKEKVPEIPPAPEFPNLPEITSKAPEKPEPIKHQELPSLPNTSFGQELNSEMVKSAVTDHDGGIPPKQSRIESPPRKIELKEESLESPIISSPPQDSFEEFPIQSFSPQKINEEPSPQFQNHTEPRIPSIMERPPKRKTLELSRTNLEPESKTKQEEPIFVRIDKFQNAKKDFKEIQKKIKQIELTLRKVQEEKLKEDKEVSSWIENLEKVKSRLNEIDSEIFSKV